MGFVLIFRKVERGKWCLRNQGKEGRAVAEPGSLTLPVASQEPRSLGFEVGPPVSFGQTPPCLLKNERGSDGESDPYSHSLEQRYSQLSVHSRLLEGLLVLILLRF